MAIGAAGGAVAAGALFAAGTAAYAATAFIIAAMINFAIVGAVVGGVYAAATGENIGKGVLYGAIGGAVIGATYGGGMVAMGYAGGATVAGGTAAGAGTAGTTGLGHTAGAAFTAGQLPETVGVVGMGVEVGGAGAGASAGAGAAAGGGALGTLGQAAGASIGGILPALIDTGGEMIAGAGQQEAQQEAAQMGYESQERMNTANNISALERAELARKTQLETTSIQAKVNRQNALTQYKLGKENLDETTESRLQARQDEEDTRIRQQGAVQAVDIKAGGAFSGPSIYEQVRSNNGSMV